MGRDKAGLAMKKKKPKLRRDFQLDPRLTLISRSVKAVDVAVALFTVYHVECENYDRSVCTGPRMNDGVMPANGHERKLIGKHAAGLAARVLERAERLGLNRKQLEAGDEAVQSMPYARVEADYERAKALIGGTLEK